ncbi:MAG: VWA domain-containing protein [Blastocatellia bacterium]
MLKIQILLSTILIIFLFVPVLAQSPNKQNQIEEPVIKVDVDLVSFDAHVLSKKTNSPVKGLTEKNFEVYEDNIKQEITNFSQDKLPLSVLLLVDVSGSIRPFEMQIREAAIKALELLKPEDEVSIMAFGTGTAALETFTTDKQLIISNMEKVKSVAREFGRGTDFNNAVEDVIYHIRTYSKSNYRKVAVVITDNILLKPKSKEKKEAIKSLLENNINVNCLIVQDEKQSKKVLRFASQITERIDDYVDETGGEIFDTTKSSILEEFVELIEHLRARYSIGYSSSNTKTDDKLRKIKVKIISTTLESGADKDDLVIKARQGYYASKK